MMLLWDQEMATFKPRLETLEASELLKLAVRTIDWTLTTLPHPIQTDSVRDWLESAVVSCRSAIDLGASQVVLPDEIDSDYEEVEEDTDEAGTSHFLSAIDACCNKPDGMSVRATYNVLSYCYEGSLDREGIPVVTIEAEQANARCRDVINYQQQLIAEATP